MNKTGLKKLIGKKINLESAFDNDFDFDNVNYTQPILEKSLFDYEVQGQMDKNGFIAYSIRVTLDGAKIRNIQRISLSANISGESMIEFNLNEFGSSQLEKEAYQVIRKILA